MKKIILILLCIFFTSNVLSQEEKPESVKNNMVKLNVLPLTFGSISADYERVISSKTTIGLNLTLMPKRKTPMLGIFESLIDDEAATNQFKNAKIGTFSVSPQVRFYLGKSAYRGFYVAPFLRYASHSLEIPVEYIYENQEESVVIDGSINAFSGGIALGAQWQLSEKIYLDWTIVGPLYGGHKGTLSGQKNLNPEEVHEIEQALNDFEGLPFVDYTHEVNDNGVTVDTKGGWAGLRIGLAVGYRF